MNKTKVPKPDPNIGLAALEEIALSREALDWYKNYAADVLVPEQKKLAELNERVTTQQMDIAGDQQRIANETYDFQKETFRPVEKAIADQAMEFDSADFADRKAAEAQAEVQSAYDTVGRQINQDLGRRGVSMSAAQLAANASDLGLKRAAATAGVTRQARDAADTMSFARKMDAASVGRGLPSQQATAAQIALQGGQGASGVQQSTAQGAQAAGQFVGQGYNTAIGGIQGAGSLFAEGSRQNQYAAAQNAANSGGLLGTLVGAGTGLGSSWLLGRR